MSQTFHREFPNSKDAEMAVLASLLLSPVEVRALCSDFGVDEDRFYQPAHQELWKTFSGVIDAGIPLEFVTIGQKLRENGMMEKVGGMSFINELFILLPSAANIRFYLEDLHDKYIRRRLIEVATEAAQSGYEPGGKAEELVAEAHGEIGKLIHTRSVRKSVREVLQEIVDEVREGVSDAGLINLPIQGIHGKLRLYRGDLFIISAPTSCGKTAMAAQFALAAAMQGMRSAFYPLEMAQKQVLKRAIAQLGGNNADFVRGLVVRNGNNEPPPFVAEAVREFMATAKAIADMPIHMRDDLLKWEQIRADLRTEHAKKPFTFVMIDYLQLIQTQTRHERRQLAIAEITQGAKNLAKELDCCICIPSQQNAQGGTREAQDAENDASALVRITGEEDENKDVRPGRITIWKQREGERHIDLPLKFNGLLTRFEAA